MLSGDNRLPKKVRNKSNDTARFDAEIDAHLMYLAQVDGPLGSPVSRFRYPHFFTSSGAHFNSRGALVRQGRAEINPFRYRFPRFVKGNSLLGTGVGWISMKDLALQPASQEELGPSLGILGQDGGLATMTFPRKGVSASDDSADVRIDVHNLSGQNRMSTRTRIGFWQDAVLPSPGMLAYDETRARLVVASRVGDADDELFGGIVCFDIKSGDVMWHQAVSAGLVEISRDGSKLLVVTHSGVAVVGMKTGQLMSRVRECDHGGALFPPYSTRWMGDRVIAWHPDTKFIVLGGPEESGVLALQLRETRTWRALWEFQVANPKYESPGTKEKSCVSPNRYIREIAVSRCGKLIAFLAGDLYLVDGGSGELLQMVPARDNVRTWEGVHFSSDGHYMALASHEMLLLYDIQRARSMASGAPNSSNWLGRLTKFWLD